MERHDGMWQYTIHNNRYCPQSKVILDGREFQITESINPSILAIYDTQHSVSILTSKPINFTYDHDQKLFMPVCLFKVWCHLRARVFI